MTSIALSSNNNTLRPLVAAILLALFTLALITYSSHAVERHGIEEVNLIRSCMRREGPVQTWRSKTDPSTYYHICLLPDGRYGLQIVVERARELIEKTAFIPRDGLWSQVTDYLSQFATRFNGSIPH